MVTESKFRNVTYFVVFLFRSGCSENHLEDEKGAEAVEEGHVVQKVDEQPQPQDVR